MTFLLALIMLLVPCQDESASGCTWYAGWQGNGQGDTVTILPPTPEYPHGYAVDWADHQ